MANRRDHDSLRQHSSVPGKAARSALRLAVIAMPLLLLVACEMGHNATPTATLTSEEETATATPPTSTPEPTATLSSYEGYLEVEIPPCTPLSGSSLDPCKPRGPIESFWRSAGGSNPAYHSEEPLTVRFLLDYPVLSFTPHVVLRGTYMRDTVRCTSGDPGRTPSYVQQWDSLLINCYADVRVKGYVLGEGPSRLTVLVDFHHYWEGYYAEWAEEENTTEEEVIEQIRTTSELVLEQGYDPSGGDEGIYGREVILFVGPPHAEGRVVWEVFTTWNVERREDGVVVAVHPHRDNWKVSRPEKYQEYRSALEIELSRFKKEVLAAHQARVSEHGGRIAPSNIEGRVEGVALPMLITDIHDLGEYMVSTGAYGHADGTPVPPPPVPGEGDSVPDIGVDDSTPTGTPAGPGDEEGAATPVIP